MKKLKISLKFKIAFLFILLVVIMMTTVTYIFTIRERNLRLEQVKLRMERLANNIATIRSVETEDWDVYQTYIDNQITLNPDIVYIAIFNEMSELKSYALNLEWIDVSDYHRLDRTEQAKIVRLLDQRQLAEESQRDLESKAVNIIIGDQNLGTVKVGFSLVELNDELRENLTRNLELALVFILLAIVVSYYMSKRIVTPLGKLTAAMFNISKGDLRQKLSIRSSDEIGEMANTFNFMTKGLLEKGQIERFSRELGFAVELEKLTSLIVERIVIALDAKQGALFLKDRDSLTRYHLNASYPRVAGKDITLDINEELDAYFLDKGAPQETGTIPERFELVAQLNRCCAIGKLSFVAPITAKNQLIGILLLEATNVYSDGEKAFLSTLIGQSAFAIQNAFLYQELTEQERLKRELEIARMIQIGLLPQATPENTELDIDGICIPATEIGGDYYDFFRLNDRSVGIAIADVTGKGASAAFYMAVVKGMMLSSTAVFSSPKNLLCELNKRLYGKMDRKIFITMIYAVFDTRKRILKFARAGHNSLILRRANDSKIDCLEPPGISLGLAPSDLFDENISEQQVTYESGDAFLFYTDGVSEAMNIRKEEFGEQRLLETIRKSGFRTANQVREATIQAVNSFVQDAPQHDDMTMVTVIAG
ncbi:SpoIIE family protein phosphatase [candidate division KSB1 bacterium]|nr:SpoIIE family protein phosphatase [candidate division KSB1 bacterium]